MGEGTPPEFDDLADQIQGANPFVGLTPGQVAQAAVRWAAALGVRPSVLVRELFGLAGDEVRVIAGSSPTKPDPKDRRFSDPVWSHPVWRRVQQSYLVTHNRVMESVDSLDLDEKSAQRARFALMQVLEALAPTNNLLTNPVALQRAVSSRGKSLFDGARHLIHDVRFNGCMPSQVDTRPFRVGETVAATPGHVIYRTPMFELIQYAPSTSHVHVRPTVLIPPQINRFYFLDLAPGRSFVEFAVSRGIQTFMISWRNPGPRQRDWSLDDYSNACVDAMRAAASVAGSEDVNVAGFCAGGMTTSAVLAHLATSGNPLVNAGTLAVTMLDAHVSSTLNMFATERTVASAAARSRKKGVLEGESLARVFAFVRPNDLVWNYFVANYLLGENPPAFDVLAWNKDTTNLPATLHAQFLDMWIENSLVDPGALAVMGSPVDLGKVTNDMYVVGALTDHLVPWRSAHAAVGAFGGDVRFVLSNSGHIQALVNPPDNPKASFYATETTGDGQTPVSHVDWLEAATKRSGSWWEDWAAWTAERSGPRRRRPSDAGSDAFRPVELAPGRYVRS